MADNLWKMKVMQEPICEMCKAKCENVFLALTECRMARKIWKFTHLKDEIKHIIKEDVLSVMHRLTVSLGNNEFN